MLTRQEAAAEQALIEKAKNGCHDSFTVLYNNYRLKVIGVLIKITGGKVAKEELEDCTQEIFIQVWRKLNQYRGESQFSTWLYRVSINQYFMSTRKNAKLHKRGLGIVTSLEDMQYDDGRKMDTPKPLIMHDTRLEGVLDRITILRAVEDLPPSAKKVFRLKELEGYNHNEISEIIGCSMGNSKSQLHKARQKLAKALTHRNPKMVYTGVKFNRVH